MDMILGITGVLILAALIKFLGTDSIAQAFEKLGLALIPLTLLYGLWQLCYAYAWTLTFVSTPTQFSFWRVFAIYLAGDSINYAVPSGNLAGEPVKPYLMKDHWPMTDGLASVIINKLSETASMVLFLCIGVGVGFASFSLPLPFRVGVLVVFGGTLAAVSLFFWRQTKGLMGPALSCLSKISFFSSFIQKRTDSVAEIDQRVRGYYRTQKVRFSLSLLFNFLGWCGGALETFLILRLLGLPAGLATVVSIEAFSLLVNNVFFFLPGRMGGGETGKAFIFSTLGFGAAMGLSFGIIRRVREVFWASVGFSFLVAWRSLPRLKAVS
jgi:uncharacterized protein (TIRG00374 family)